MPNLSPAVPGWSKRGRALEHCGHSCPHVHLNAHESTAGVTTQARLRACSEFSVIPFRDYSATCSSG